MSEDFKIPVFEKLQKLVNKAQPYVDFIKSSKVSQVDEKELREAKEKLEALETEMMDSITGGNYSKCKKSGIPFDKCSSFWVKDKEGKDIDLLRVNHDENKDIKDYRLCNKENCYKFVQAEPEDCLYPYCMFLRDINTSNVDLNKCHHTELEKGE